jgi:hypothetical protein
VAQSLLLHPQQMLKPGLKIGKKQKKIGLKAWAALYRVHMFCPHFRRLKDLWA